MWTELEPLLLRIRNWARWCRDNGARQGHCRSIEHRYRSPQWGHWDATPPEIQGDIDVLDAYVIEDAVRQLHWRQRQLIKLLYVKHWQQAWICNKIGIPHRDYVDTHYFSVIALNSLVKTHGNKRNVQGYNSGNGPSVLLAA